MSDLADKRRARQEATEASWLAAATGSDARGFYATLGIHWSAGVSDATVSCFANPAGHRHNDKNRSCSINTTTGLWRCHACGEKGNAYHAAVASGRSAKDAAELAKSYGLFAGRGGGSQSTRGRENGSQRPFPTDRDVAEWQANLQAGDLVGRLGEARGWRPVSIRRLGLGWDDERIVFPIRDRDDGLIGVARYLPWCDGAERKMVSWPGSKRDLFPAPESLYTRRPVWLVEGEPDAVAAWSLGLVAVAVPGAKSWRRGWGARFKHRDVIVCCDCDQPGRELAAIAVDALLPHAKTVRTVDLEPGRDDGYDIGDLLIEAIGLGEDGRCCVRGLLDRFADAAVPVGVLELAA